MSDPRETLARIRAQADAATEGPWYAEPVGRWRNGARYSSVVEPGLYDVATRCPPGDAEFIAAARTDVPWLLEQIERRDKALEAVLELHKDGGESQGYLDDGSYGDMPHCCTECGSLGEYGVPYPCPTVTAITTALNGDAA